MAGDRIYVNDRVQVDDNDQLYVHRRDLLALAARLMEELTEAERLDIITDYCRGCGTDDPRCHCQNDE